MSLTIIPSKRPDTVLFVGNDPLTDSTISLDLTHDEGRALARSIQEQMGDDAWEAVEACRRLVYLLTHSYADNVTPMMWQAMRESGVVRVDAEARID